VPGLAGMSGVQPGVGVAWVMPDILNVADQMTCRHRGDANTCGVMILPNQCINPCSSFQLGGQGINTILTLGIVGTGFPPAGAYDATAQSVPARQGHTSIS
jgi:hypothetical protein